MHWLRAIALLAVTFALLAPGTAAALPGDSPIVLRAPTDGAVVAARSAGVTVLFSCPAYRREIYGEADSPTISTGGPDDYQVRFSDAAALGQDGVLASNPYGSDVTARDAGDGMCTADLDTDENALSPEVVGGRVYWQAYRSCVGCAGQLPETSAVASFDIRATVQATLVVPKRMYNGYLGEFAVASKAPLQGAQVVLERRVGTRWRAVTEEAYRSDRTPLYAQLPAGRQAVSRGDPHRQVTIRRSHPTRDSAPPGPAADVPPRRWSLPRRHRQQEQHA